MIRIVTEQKPRELVFYAQAMIAAIEADTGELIKRLDVQAERISEVELVDEYMPTFLSLLESNDYDLEEIINFGEVVNMDMQVISDALTAKLQEQTGLATEDTVDLIAELIEQIKRRPTADNINLYAEIMLQN